MSNIKQEQVIKLLNLLKGYQIDIEVIELKIEELTTFISATNEISFKCYEILLDMMGIPADETLDNEDGFCRDVHDDYFIQYVNGEMTPLEVFEALEKDCKPNT